MVTIARRLALMLMVMSLLVPPVSAVNVTDGPCTSVDIGDTKISDGSKYRCGYFQRGKTRVLVWVYQGQVKKSTTARGTLTSDQAAACWKAVRENSKKPKYCP